MNKVEERRVFDTIFSGPAYCNVRPSESPDFLCYADGMPQFGCEITELFASETDARTKKLPGYLLDVINNRKYRHRDDIKRLPIAKVGYTTPTGEFREVEGVTQERPPHSECLKLLSSIITGKSLKLPLYHSKAPLIDLAVVDSSSLFRVKDRTKASFLVRSEVVQNCIINSGFREIHLILRTDTDHMFILPARLNLLAEHGILFEHAFTEVLRHRSSTIGDFVFHCLFYLSTHGFPEARGFIINHEIHVCTSMADFIVAKGRRELKDTMGVIDLGAVNEFKPSEHSSENMSDDVKSAIHKEAKKRSFSITLTRDANKVMA